MKAWRWLVGQGSRLRRSIVGVLERGVQRRRQADDRFDVADERAVGPPEHWVARVRRGAPGLLEPSLRRRGEPTGAPVDERLVLSQTELEPQPGSLEEPEREYVPPEPPIRPRRPDAPVRASRLRKVLRRGRSVSPGAADVSPAPTADQMRRDLHAATRRVGESADVPAGEPPSRRRPLDEMKPPPARPGQKVADQPEGPPRRSEVVEFEAPAQRRTARAEQAASPDRPIRADAARQSAENVPQAELAVEEIRTDRVWERNVPAPAPKRTSASERLREPARPSSLRESSLEAGPPGRSPAEPLSAVDRHPWPELPPAQDQFDSDVEAALRAWEHQRRLDHEQTRL